MPGDAKKVYIVGFAPSWEQTPFDDTDAEIWGLNALHKIAGDRRWTRWFQLHDLNVHNVGDEEHNTWLADLQIPLVMFEEHIPEGLSAVPFPKDAVIAEFGDYFNNSISWMIALAILEGFEEIHVYGVDMAQDTEYGHQRPSCEYFLGLARGMGREVYVPVESDLLKVPYLYGVEDEKSAAFRRKMEGRLQSLQGQYANAQREIAEKTALVNQLTGAVETTQYILRAWSDPLSAESTKTTGD